MVEQEGDEAWIRQQVIDTALALNQDGLSQGTSGNVSARWREGMLITPSAVPYADLLPADIVFVDAAGVPAAGGMQPSSEWRFHLAAYSVRPDAAAIVHCHSCNATALACAHKAIPAFHYMVAVAGGHDIPLVPYAIFGGEQLAENVAEGLKARKACLLANHGQVACGSDLPRALALAHEVEALAAQYIKALAVGEPKLLASDEMDRVLEKFATYGQQWK